MNIKQRSEILEPEIVKLFNLQFMIRTIIGYRWSKIVQKEQQALMDAFRNISVSTYASRFNNHSGQIFRTIKEKKGPKKTTLVLSLIEMPNDKPIRLTYVMRQFNGNWKVIDVLLAGGISEMALRVSEYRGILRKRGARYLADALDARAQKLIDRR